MRKVVSGLFVSLDGVAQSPNEWQFAFDEEMGAALGKTLETADTILLGRATFTEWAGYWPTVTDGEDAGFAKWINDSPKYVVSSTLDSVDDWANSTLINGDLAAAIEELKAGEGKDITVAGSPMLVRSLLEQDLLDELVLLIRPVVAGEGRKRLFADNATLKKLELVSAQPTSSGVINRDLPSDALSTARRGPGTGTGTRSSRLSMSSRQRERRQAGSRHVCA